MLVKPNGVIDDSFAARLSCKSDLTNACDNRAAAG